MIVPVCPDGFQHLFMEIRGLRADAWSKVQMGEIQILFRTLQLYGATLSLNTGDECVYKVSPHVHANSLTLPSSPDATASAGHAGARFIIVGQVKGCCATINRRKPERLSRVEHYALAFVRRGMGELNHTHPRHVSI